jgi:hypothetical protein
MKPYKQIMPGVYEIIPRQVTQSVLDEQEKSFQRIEQAYEKFYGQTNRSADRALTHETQA